MHACGRDNLQVSEQEDLGGRVSQVPLRGGAIMHWIFPHLTLSLDGMDVDWSGMLKLLIV